MSSSRFPPLRNRLAISTPSSATVSRIVGTFVGVWGKFAGKGLHSGAVCAIIKAEHSHGGIAVLTHQTQNTVPGETYNVYRYRERFFYPHFHKSFEVAYLSGGTACFTVGGRDFSLCTGDFVMVLPFEPHSFTVRGDGELTVTVFSAGLAPAFSRMTQGMRGESAVFRCGNATRAFFEAGISATAEAPVTEVPRGAELLEVGARLSAVCADYIRAVPLHPCESGTAILARIPEYIDRHFREDISVGSAAKALGYSESRLSAVIRDQSVSYTHLTLPTTLTV